MFDFCHCYFEADNKLSFYWFDQRIISTVRDINNSLVALLNQALRFVKSFAVGAFQHMQKKVCKDF